MSIPFSFNRIRRHHLIIGGVFVLISLIGSIRYVSADTQDQAKDGRLITIHDRGSERVILTHAQNIREDRKSVV